MILKQWIAFLLIFCMLLGMTPALAAEDNIADRMLKALEPLLDRVGELDDEKLLEQLTTLSETVGVTLTEEQLSELAILCRHLAELDGTLEERLEKGRQTVQTIIEAKEKAVGFLARIKDVLARVAETFSKIAELLRTLSGAVGTLHNQLS